MGKRKSKRPPVAPADPAENGDAMAAAESGLEEAFSELDGLYRMRRSIKGTVQRFQHEGRVTASRIRKLLTEILAALE